MARRASGNRFRGRWLVMAGLAGLAVAIGLLVWIWPTIVTLPRLARLREFLVAPDQHVDWQMRAGDRCPGAPFLLPTDGYLGFGYGDSWRPGHRHTGFDIFSPLGLNETPVLAAYAGYLTRSSDWISTVIIRVPDDPLQPGRQIWVYYTHMADPDGASFVDAAFPPGTEEIYVEAGTLLGHQGNYSGDPGNPTGTHLHISIVRDDGRGHFLNETRLENTLDPSPYLGLQAGVYDDWSEPIGCR
jgi:murein DD-endopeptidase MepM/ murein hydrolase activator NlpD